MANSASSFAHFCASYVCNQPWSLPDSIIYHITKNPSSPKCYEKMIQSCKHFFIKNPILVVKRFTLLYRKDTENAWFNENSINFEKLTSKIWITDDLKIRNHNLVKSDILSSIIPFIYQSDIKVLVLYNQIFNANYLQFITSNCKIFFDNVTVVDKNSIAIPLQNFIEGIHDISPQNTSELFKIPCLPNLKSLGLLEVPESFDIERFFNFIRKNNVKTRISLSFCFNISDDDKNRLLTIVDKIVAEKNHSYKPPYIGFPGFERYSEQKLWNLYSQN